MRSNNLVLDRIVSESGHKKVFFKDCFPHETHTHQFLDVKMPPNGVIDFMRSNEAQLSAIRPAKPSLAPEVSGMFDNLI